MQITRLAGVALAAALLAACGPDGGRSDYQRDGDTGAASPATTPTPDNPGAPDSTTGLSPERAGSPGTAGTRTTTDGDSGIRSTSPASTAPGQGNNTPRPGTGGRP